MSGTYTVVQLNVSAAAYDEIAAKLREVGYDHCFSTYVKGYREDGEMIDMTGIAIVKEDGNEETNKEGRTAPT